MPAATGNIFTYAPATGRVFTAKSYAITPYTLGKVTIVDGTNGADTGANAGSLTGKAFQTIQAAISAINTASATGYTIWVQPGTYTLSGGITIPNSTVLKGSSPQNTTITYSTSSTATMITMGTSCCIEDLSISMTPGYSTDSQTFKAVVFGGTTAATSFIRNCIITINNTSGWADITKTSTVTGVEFSGTGTLLTTMSTLNNLRSSTVFVNSNGKGAKRGILVSGSNQISTRDVSIYVATPTNTSSIGSYVGVETNDSSNVGTIQLYATTVTCTAPSTTPYTASDILQTKPTAITNPKFLATAGIQVGPGTGLVTKSAGDLGFSSFQYGTIVSYNLTGLVRAGTSASTAGYLSPNTTIAASAAYPFTTNTKAYLTLPQASLLSGMTVGLSTGPSGSNTVVVLVSNGSTATSFTLTLTGTTTFASIYNISSLFNAGDKLNLTVTYTGAGTSNTAQNLVVQLYLL